MISLSSPVTDSMTSFLFSSLHHTLSVLCSIPPEQIMKQTKNKTKDIKRRKIESIKSDTISDNLSEPVPNHRRYKLLRITFFWAERQLYLVSSKLNQTTVE